MKYRRYIFFIVMFIIICVIYKECVLLKYTYNIDLESITDKIKNKDTIDIYNKKVSKYFTYKNLRIEDVFNNFTKVEEDSLRMYDYGKENLNSYISIAKKDSYLNIFINGFKDVTGESIKINSATNLINKNNITNDIELFEYLVKNYNNSINIFRSNSTIEENYYIKKFIKNVLPSIEKYTNISGDYSGYIIKNDSKSMEVYLCDKLENYVITFGGNFDINEIYKLIGTIIIDEEK